MTSYIGITLTAAAVAGSSNVGMNGKYTISNSSGAHFEYGIGHRGEYIDVYSYNISTHYSEVYWTMQPPIQLPADFVKRFDGKVVALTGYEVDSVRVHQDGLEESVPITQQYNHHHNAYLNGKATTLVNVGPAGSSEVPMHGGVRSKWEPRQVPGVPMLKDVDGNEVMTTAFIVDGNGGEYRKTFHGTGAGTAMLVANPTSFGLQPMMINTKNPNGGVHPGGPLPSSSRAPLGAAYSGLLECPCTDRKKKVMTNLNTKEVGTCKTQVASAAVCFTEMAALGLTPILANATINSATGAPPGCSVVATQKGYEATFNTNSTSAAACGPPTPQSGGAPAPIRSLGDETVVGVHVSVDLNADANCKKPTAPPSDLAGAWDFFATKQFPNAYSITFSEMQGTPGTFKIVPSTAGSVCNGRGGCVGVLKGSTFTMTQGFEMTGAVAADFSSITWTNGAVWSRKAATCAGAGTITMQGPADVWFGAGFGNPTMKGTYAIVVDGAAGDVTERSLGDHDPGQQLAPSVTVLNNTVVNGIRTVVVTRTLAGASAQHYTFAAGAQGVAMVAAVGSSPTFAYHKARGSTTLMLVQVGSPMCICAGGMSGSIDGVSFGNHCAERPTSDLLALKNDICFIETYGGGLKCCSHKSILLDSNQTVPPAVDTFNMKFRLYFEEYTNQKNAFFMFWTNEQGAGEYDVPQCKPGTPASECVYTTTSLFKVRDSMRKCSSMSNPWCAANWNEGSDVELLRAGTHCHAPACLGTDLYTCPAGSSGCNATTGKLVCSNTPIYGVGEGSRFDEPGYLAVPPCLWGTPEEGLQPPPKLKLDDLLYMVKKVNNTNYHYGVMGQWQMRGAWAS